MRVFFCLALLYFILFLTIISGPSSSNNCISSMLVKGVSISRGSSTTYTPSCYWKGSIKGALVLDDSTLIKQIQEEALAFESFLEKNHLLRFVSGITVEIKDQPDSRVRISKDKILLNFNQVRSEIFLQRSLFKSWALSNGSNLFLKEPVLQEIISDVLLEVIWNTQTYPLIPIKNWLSSVYSERDICEKGGIPLDQRGICDFLKKDPHIEMDFISPWSFRPLVTSSALKIYKNLSYEKKIHFIKHLVDLISYYKGSLGLHEVEMNTFSNTYNKIINRLFYPILGKEIQAHLEIDNVFEFHKGLKILSEKSCSYRSLSEESHRIMKSSILLLGQKTPSVLNKEKLNCLPTLRMAKSSSNKNFLMKMDRYYYNLSNGSKLVIKRPNSRRWTLIQKEFPTLSEVKNIQTEYLTVLKIQEPFYFMSFQSLLNGYSNFPWRDQLDSVTLYIPAIRLLADLSPKHIFDKNLRYLSREPQIFSALGWNPIQVELISQ